MNSSLHRQSRILPINSLCENDEQEHQWKDSPKTSSKNVCYLTYILSEVKNAKGDYVMDSLGQFIIVFESLIKAAWKLWKYLFEVLFTLSSWKLSITNLIIYLFNTQRVFRMFSESLGLWNDFIFRTLVSNTITAWSVRIRSYSGPYFSIFGLNTERYSVSLRIQSECGKIRTIITPNRDTFYAANI